MAHTKQARKRIRQTIVRTERNRMNRSRVRTFVKKAEKVLEKGDIEAAREAVRVAQSELHRAVNKGVLKRNTASRKVSRLNARLKAASLG